MDATRRLRGAVIGLGNVAVKGHLPGWRARRDAVLVAATLRTEDLATDAQRWLTELEHRPAATRLRLTGAGSLAEAGVKQAVGGFDAGEQPSVPVF